MERRPKRQREIVERSSEIDRQLNDSDSSLFSSGGESEYHPSSVSDESTDSEVSENSEHNLEEVTDFTMGLNPDNLVIDDLDNESVHENDVAFNDPNVLLVVNSIHQRYVQNQSPWKDTNDNPRIHNFLGHEQVHINSTNPIEIFANILDGKLIDKICCWVNKRAEVMRGNPLPQYSNMNKWEAINSEELKKFLGLCMLMGNLQGPSIQHYWSTSPLYEHPIFSKTMARNRFQTILQCLCFYDADTDSTAHRLHKIDNVLNHILQNFQKVFSPGRNLSLDEAMILWRGRLSFRQYIKNKRHKFGIKLYELCTHDGFILNILVYSGKGKISHQEKGHTFQVVMQVMEKYLGKGHTLYLDNYYNSVALADALMGKQTNMCGTLQQNREGNPADVINKKLKKGEYISRQKGDITVMKWRDKRNVLTISTTNGPEMENVVNHKGNTINKPSMVVNYNKFMSGIDRSDQMISYYSTPRKSLRWYIKIFFHLVDACLWNSKYIFSKLCPDSKITYLQFRDIITKSFN